MIFDLLEAGICSEPFLFGVLNPEELIWSTPLKQSETADANSDDSYRLLLYQITQTSKDCRHVLVKVFTL